MIETIFQFLLFILSFLISYGFLKKIKIFQSGVNLIISLTIAFYVLLTSLYYFENLIQVLAFLFISLFIIFSLALLYFARKTK
ncbi:MAG: hypothetical protein QW472_05215 [Candidatus Aenigmatarchaeota archaeon]